MKLIIKFLILFFIFYLCYVIVAESHADTGSAGAPKKETAAREKTPEFNNDEEPEMEDDDIYSYDQEFFLKKLYQKGLPALTKKEKIIWAFRLAETNTFL